MEPTEEALLFSSAHQYATAQNTRVDPGRWGEKSFCNKRDGNFDLVKKCRDE
jgi:hypothetical protein